MWIEKDKLGGNHYNIFVDGSCIAKTHDIEAGLHAMWLNLGSPSEFTLYVDEDDKHTVRKRFTELPTEEGEE